MFGKFFTNHRASKNEILNKTNQTPRKVADESYYSSSSPKYTQKFFQKNYTPNQEDKLLKQSKSSNELSFRTQKLSQSPNMKQDKQLQYLSGKITTSDIKIDENKENISFSNYFRWGTKEFDLQMPKVNEQNNDQHEKLFLACQNDNYIHMLSLLKNVNQTLTNAQGQTLLMIAVMNNSKVCTSLLLSQNPKNLNQQDYQGNTALHYALFNQNLAIIDSLLSQQEIQYDIPNNAGFTQQHIVESKNNSKLKQLFDKKFRQTDNIEEQKQFFELQGSKNKQQSQYLKTLQNLSKAVKQAPFQVRQDKQKPIQKNLDISFDQDQTNQRQQLTKLASERVFYQKEQIKKNEELLKLIQKRIEQFTNSNNSSKQTVSVSNMTNQTSIAHQNSSQIANQLQVDEEKKQNFIKLNEYELQGLIGRGSFGDVYLIVNKSNKTKFAMKVIDKDKLKKQNLVKYAKSEISINQGLDHPFVVKLHQTFQTSTKLILLMDYLECGSLAQQITLQRQLPEDLARLYIAPIILVIEYLHQNNIVYRDLKPDNIVIGSDGYAMLCDFGLAKPGISGNTTGAQSFCGSMAYLAPEVLARKGHGKAVDWYLVGVVLYEVLVGVPPYYAETKEKLFHNIEQAQLYLPKYLSVDAKSLLKQYSKLLERDSQKRLSAQNIRDHPFFGKINWDQIIQRKIEMPKLEKQTPHRVSKTLNQLLGENLLFKLNDDTQFSEYEYVNL